jgi:hypothetical protein
VGTLANKKAIIMLAALIISVAALIIATTGVLSNPSVDRTVPSSGQIQSSPDIGIYSNSACTQNATTIDWGTLQRGLSTSRTIYIKNTGPTNTVLTLSTTSWNPTYASSAITLTWNLDGRTLAPDEVVQATLTLAVSSTINASITSFSFNVQITGTG